MRSDLTAGVPETEISAGIMAAQEWTDELHGAPLFTPLYQETTAWSDEAVIPAAECSNKTDVAAGPGTGCLTRRKACCVAVQDSAFDLFVAGAEEVRKDFVTADQGLRASRRSGTAAAA
ncbi:hypothetical protein AMAG_16617 [Allomyces macrogynus ATCC 38327]|uniref:Uncharacterized protein n=1 Tax=Allomyces macrogynus (strain ATCC 38327) TaxID=578462 RepID=A0A0L0TBF0_ALLM3|nr:hypothetical protein AMAG_16617 [Allomyces macrogynus ATCC 38327]|eukprot:KNE72123.1 hypothetical protein AMAG_16617 [Allomyces macrogynus ATCC 38327]